jgi:hypothetical protein
LKVSGGFYASGGGVYTLCGGKALTNATITGDVTFEGTTVIQPAQDNQTLTAALYIDGTLTIQGSAEYKAKLDSTNNTRDVLLVTGSVTLGGNSKLTAISINWPQGGVPKGKQFDIIRSLNGTIGGAFATENLNLNDGTNGKYNANIVNNQRANDTFRLFS